MIIGHKTRPEAGGWAFRIQISIHSPIMLGLNPYFSIIWGKVQPWKEGEAIIFKPQILNFSFCLKITNWFFNLATWIQRL